MKNTNISFLLFLVVYCNSLIANTDPVTKKSVLAIAEKVADWQLVNLPVKDWWDRPFDHQYGQYLIDWEYACFLLGFDRMV